MRQELEQALTAMNAAWTGEQIYGSDHPVVRKHVRDAAEAFRRAAERCSPATAFFLPDRVTIADRVIDAGPVLLQGLFRGMGESCPDCLQVTPGATPEDVRRLVRTIADGGARRTGAIVGPFALRWVHAGSDSPDVGQGVPLAGVLAQDLEHVWGAAAAGGEASRDQLEHVAGEIASAITTDSATLMPLAGLKRHDEYTFVHAINVGLMSSALCEAVGLSPERTRQITLGAMLHDVGKQAMPADIINKPGKLSDAERAVLNAHPAAGARILAASTDLPPVVLTIAYEHHMNLDGTGYPRRPPCLRIALPSQIVHIADVFDALRTHRPYREALPIERALAIMGEEAGRCYDAELFRVFCDRVVRRFTHADAAAAPRATPRSEAA